MGEADAMDRQAFDAAIKDCCRMFEKGLKKQAVPAAPGGQDAGAALVL